MLLDLRERLGLRLKRIMEVGSFASGECLISCIIDTKNEE